MEEELIGCTQIFLFLCEYLQNMTLLFGYYKQQGFFPFDYLKSHEQIWSYTIELHITANYSHDL